jgi:hypothetical protein
MADGYVIEVTSVRELMASRAGKSGTRTFTTGSVQSGL